MPRKKAKFPENLRSDHIEPQTQMWLDQYVAVVGERSNGYNALLTNFFKFTNYSSKPFYTFATPVGTTGLATCVEGEHRKTR